jgi:hypothetical protein
MFRGIRETKPGLFLIVAISLTSLAAVAQPASWQQYVVPESGAVAQIPTDIFSEDGGKPESGYGRRFFTSDRNANLTVQSIPNDANDTPAVFLAWSPALAPRSQAGSIAAERRRDTARLRSPDERGGIRNHSHGAPGYRFAHPATGDNPPHHKPGSNDFHLRFTNHKPRVPRAYVW